LIILMMGCEQILILSQGPGKRTISSPAGCGFNPLTGITVYQDHFRLKDHIQLSAETLAFSRPFV